MGELTPSQMSAIEYTERICSILSLLGTAFIMITFLTSRAFHNKPINRLVFYASIGNVCTNIGTLISTTGPKVGGSLCQFQGFLIQMFMPADALWTLAMACNVYLTFFHKYDAKALRGLEWKYLIICYGLPFIPALVYFFINTSDRGKIYGNAVLWCWVSVKWDFLRVAAFYGPVWLVILVTIIIYIIAGKEIFEKRRALQEFSSSADPEPAFPMTGKGGFQSRVTKEVHITSEPATSPDDASQSSLKMVAEDMGKGGPGYDPYSVTIEIGPEQQWNAMRSPSVASPGVGVYQRPHVTHDPARSARIAANKAAFGYARVSLLFFCAILVTWVPSTINRVFSLVHPTAVNFGLSFTSALVLPLQGFWNSVIYICTSLPACRSYFSDIAGSISAMRRGGNNFNYNSRPTLGGPVNQSKPSIYSRRRGDETESTKGFARI